MTHQNCDELLKIAGNQTVSAVEQLGETLKQNLQMKNESNGTTLQQVANVLNSVSDKHLAALEIALIFDKKFGTFDETCTKQLKTIDNLNRQVKKLMIENNKLSKSCTQGMVIFEDCVSSVKRQYAGDVPHDCLSLPDKVKILDMFAQHPSIETALQ